MEWAWMHRTDKNVHWTTSSFHVRAYFIQIIDVLSQMALGCSCGGVRVVLFQSNLIAVVIMKLLKN